MFDMTIDNAQVQSGIQNTPIQYLQRGGAPKLAYRHTAGDGPLVMFCGGYMSDMEGTKATHFERQCIARGQAYVRFDYSGHGSSDGRFDDGTIGAWAGDALDILDHVRTDDQKVIIIGSSMGGWISLLMAHARQDHMQGLIGIAAAPDFTEEIYHRRLSDTMRAALKDNGYVMVPSDYDEPYKFTLKFFEEAKDRLLLSHKYSWPFPVHLFQGGQDTAVLPQTVQFIQNALAGTPCDITMIDDGDHSLSRSQDLEKIDAVITDFSGISKPISPKLK